MPEKDRKELNREFNQWKSSNAIALHFIYLCILVFVIVFIQYRPAFLRVKGTPEKVDSLTTIVITGFRNIKADIADGFKKQDSINKINQTISDHIPNISPIAQADIKGISTKYGEMRKDSIGRIEIHSGIDIRADAGTKVYAMASGMLQVAGWDDGWGNRILVNCHNGYEYSIAHFSKLYVIKNEIVYKGELIGLVGSTGNSTGPHADVRIYFNGKPVNTNLFF